MERKKDSKARALLRRSADVTYYKSHLIVMGCMVIGFTALAAVCAWAVGDPIFWVVALPGALIGLPVIGWCVLNLVHIFKHAEHYRFLEVTLTHPQSTWGRKLYFTVTVEGSTRETRAVFNAYGLFSPQFNDYIDQAALIGLNDRTGELVVVKDA